MSVKGLDWKASMVFLQHASVVASWKAMSFHLCARGLERFNGLFHMFPLAASWEDSNNKMSLEASWTIEAFQLNL